MNLTQEDLIEGWELVRMAEEVLMEMLLEQSYQYQMAEMNNMGTESMEKMAYCN